MNSITINQGCPAQLLFPPISESRPKHRVSGGWMTDSWAEPEAMLLKYFKPHVQAQ